MLDMSKFIGKEPETLESLLNSQGYGLEDAEAIAINTVETQIDDCVFKVFEYPSYEHHGSWFWDSENGIGQAIVCKSIDEFLSQEGCARFELPAEKLRQDMILYRDGLSRKICRAYSQGNKKLVLLSDGDILTFSTDEVCEVSLS